MDRIKVLMIAAEAAPFAVIGDLAEITGSLPAYLKELNVDARIIIPYYKTVKEQNHPVKTVGEINLPTHNSNILQKSEIKSTELDGITYYFVASDELYDRDGIYQYTNPDGTRQDFPDNLLRFAYFSRAALECMNTINFFPDILHCFAWHAALVPVFLKIFYRGKQEYSKMKTLFTMPNLAFQGLFPRSQYDITNLPPDFFSSDFLEYYGMINLLKGGILFADKLNTVSKKYAEEITFEKFGCGLEGVLRKRKNDLCGIINGVDYSIWDPEKDPFNYNINFNHKTIKRKAKIKKKLLQEFNLDASNPERPLLIFTSNLETHKGLGLLEEIKDSLLNEDISIIVLSKGSRRYTDLITLIAERFPDRVAFSQDTRDKALLHKIIAGGDILLMPSEYEPGGLFQQLALRYGTVPLVHGTGGLADTIIDGYNGFVFRDYHPPELLNTIKRALHCFENKEKWTKLQKYGMEQDWSWATSAKKYNTIYETLNIQD